MRKIVALSYVSMDGVMEAPDQWSLPFFDDDHAAYAHGRLFNSGALLLGRVTYDGFAAAWPTMEEGTGEFGVRMNTLPKYVVSTTLDKAEWNNTTVIRENIAERIAELKDQDGQDILVYGSADLVGTLIELDLLDQLKLWIHPVIVGHGKRMFADGVDSTSWRLAGTTTFNSGTVVLDYRPAGD